MPLINLIAMAGLPGSGKSSVAEGLSVSINAPVLSVDPIEAAMWREGILQAQTGIAAYAIVAAMARENVKLGHSVVVDAVNPVAAARDMWTNLGEEMGAQVVFIEVVCENTEIHRARIEARVRSIEGMPEVTWDRVLERRKEYEPWTRERLVLDSSAASVETLVSAALQYVQAGQN